METEGVEKGFEQELGDYEESISVVGDGLIFLGIVIFIGYKPILWYAERVGLAASDWVFQVDYCGEI